MPLGEPQSVPDPEGEQYDRDMARLRISRPNTLQSFIPVVGPAWEAAADFQEGDYIGAAFNGAMAVTDMLPIGVAAKGVRAASKGVTMLKKGSVTANASAKSLRAKGVATKGQEIHHTIPLNGKSRTAQDPRNHYMFLKVMPQEEHRRLTGSWNKRPRYDRVRRVWYGTNDWQKALPTSLVGETMDAVDNFVSHKPQRKS